MSYSKQNLLQLYIEGNMPSEAQVEFDRLVKEDPSFSESLIDALSQDLGPSPDALLDRMTVDLDTRFDQMWQTVSKAGKTKFTLPSLPALPLPKWSPESMMVGGGIALFTALALLAFFNPFQNSVPSVEEQAIQGFRWTQPAPAAEQAVRPVAAVKQAVRETARTSAPQKAPVAVQAKRSAPPLVAVGGTGTTASSPKTAEELVALAMKNAPDGGQWIERSGSNTGTRVPKALPPLPPLPGAAVAPSSETARGDLLRLSVPMAQDDKVQISVIDPSGKVVRNLFSGYMKAGDHTIDWDVKDDKGKAVKAGDYNVVVSASGRTHMQKVTIK